jgi:hypothetical protein
MSKRGSQIAANIGNGAISNAVISSGSHFSVHESLTPFDLTVFAALPTTHIERKRKEHLWLGNPVSGATPTANGKGWFKHFQNGSIYYTTEKGAFEVHGAIRDKWFRMGAEGSFLGFPVTDELGSPDGRGRLSHFQGGSIYWTPQTGPFEVHGAIRDRWFALGAERSFLGYPVSDELHTHDGRGRFSNFERGQISWSPALGANTSFTSFNPQSSGGLHPMGLGGNGSPEVRRRVTIAAHMDLTDDETFGDNERGAADLFREAVVTNSMPQDLISMDGVAGGEMRVELRLDAQALINGDVIIQGKIELYEGTSEQTTDLDGTESVKFLIPRDNFVAKTFTIRNTDEGGDFAVVTMNTGNFLV